MFQSELSMSKLIAISLFIVTWNSVFAVNMTGCNYYETPLVFDATKQPVGHIYTPGFDEGQYPNHADCHYTIKAPQGYIIKLTFEEFDLEPAPWCSSDKVYVMDGPTRDDPDLGSYCGYSPPPLSVVSTKNSMHLNFKTDEKIQRKGFNARYEAVLSSEICPSGRHKCANNRCYTTEQKCNGKNDCFDGTDEVECNLPSPSYECGISSIHPTELSEGIMDRVVGGIEAKPHSWPWQVELVTLARYTFYPNRHTCGGTLIKPQWVLTAAHCLMGAPVASDWNIHLGSHDRYKVDKYEQIRTVVRIIMYPGYTGTDILGKTLNMDHDIALMKLNAPVEITEGVRPACLPTEGYTLPVDTKCQATGWGETRGSGSSSALKQAEMHVQSEENCGGRKREFMICLDSLRGHQGVCHGDSGGPLVCKIDDKWHVLGVASFVSRTNMMSGLCAVGGTKSVYNRISNKISWIEDMILKFT